MGNKNTRIPQSTSSPPTRSGHDDDTSLQYETAEESLDSDEQEMCVEDVTEPARPLHQHTVASEATTVESAVVIDQIKNKDDTPTMKDLNRYVISIYAVDWYNIGIELGIEHHVLNVTEKDHPQQSVICFRKVLDKWLKLIPNATWRMLEVALTNVRRQQLGLYPVDDVYDAYTPVAVQQNILEGLNINNCRIDIAFTRISCKLLYLLKGIISVDDICFACFTNANTELGIGYPEDLKQNLNGAKSVTEFFNILSNYPTHWSWINIQVMEKIASLNDQAIKLVEHYKTVMYGKKLVDILSEVKHPDFKIDKEFYSEIKEKWNKPLSDITFKDIQDHKLCVGEIFGVNRSAIVLIQIAKGCVENHWLIPRSLVHYAYGEYQKNINKLANFDIISIEFISTTTLLQIAASQDIGPAGVKLSEVKVEFANMTERIKDVLHKTEVSVDLLVKQLCTMSAVKMKEVPMFDEDMFGKIKTVDELWRKLMNYWDIFDYDILTFVIDITDCAEAQEILDNFLAKIDISAFEDTDLALHSEVYEEEDLMQPLLRIKVDAEKYTLNIKRQIKDIVSKIFHLEEYSLCFSNIKHDCFVYHISKATMLYLLDFKITGRMMADFATYCIIFLQINDMKVNVPSDITDMDRVFLWSGDSIGPDGNRNIGDVIEWFASNMKQQYYLMKQKKENSPFNVYLHPSLALAYGKYNRNRSRTTIGTIHLYSADMHETIAQIFDPVSEANPRIILIEGDPGVGKTTLIKEICFKWAEDKLLTSKKLVLLLSLSDLNVQKMASLEQLVQYFTKSTSQIKQLCSYLEDTQGAYVTFIIDELDKLRNKFQSRVFFTKLIRGEVLQCATVVITSRPFALGYFDDDVNRMIVERTQQLEAFCAKYDQSKGIKSQSETDQSKGIETQSETDQSKGIETQSETDQSKGIETQSETDQSKGIKTQSETLQEVTFEHRSFRHHKGISFPYYCFDKTIEILGFEQFSTNQYAAAALKDSPLKLESLQKHIEQYPHINAMCHNPAIMSLMLFICMCQSIDLPSTTTKLYAAFITCKIVDYLKKSGKVSEVATISKLEDIPEQSVHKTLQYLEKVSFDALMRDTVMFTTEELGENDPNCYGLLKYSESSISGNDDISNRLVTFIYYGIQEYFAARYVSKLPDDEVRKLLNESFLVEDFGTHDHYDGYYKGIDDPNSKSVHLYNMWVLYCGIAGEQLNHKIPFVMQDFLSIFISSDEYLRYRLHSLKQLLSAASSIPQSSKHSHWVEQKMPVEYKYDRYLHHEINAPLYVLYLFQCFQEAQDERLIKALSTSFYGHIMKGLLSHQVTSLGLFLSNSTFMKWHLHLNGCHIGDRGIHILHRYICHKARKYEIKTVHLSGNDLTELSSSLIVDIVRNIQPHELDLSHNKIYKLEDISTAMAATNTVKVFKVQHSNITAQRINAITDVLISLEHLYISSNDLGDDGAILLSKGIAITNTLKVLNIGSNNIGSAGFVAILNALVNNASLEELELSYNIIGKGDTQTVVTVTANNQNLKKFYGDCNKFGVLEIEAIAKVCTSLEELHLNHNVVGQAGATAIVSIINSNSALKKLYLDGNKFGPSGSAIIAQALTNNVSLEILSMNDNAIDQDGATAIASIIANNSTLQELSVSNNNFGPSGATMIANALTSNTSMKRLYMNKNSIGQGGAEAFASAIASNKSLQYLSLSYDNTINENVAVVIISSLHNNNTITSLDLYNKNRYTKNVKDEIDKINSARKKLNDVQQASVYYNKLEKQE